jgi:hypothetical protein
MDTHISETYGAARTIRYLVTSIDDLREAAETVRFIIHQGCNRDDAKSIMNSVAISAVSLPKSLSSFIIGFDVPRKVLEVISTSRSVVPSNGERLERNVANPEFQIPGVPEPEISVANNRSNFGFTVVSLTDLIDALSSTLQLLRSRSKRFEFVNLKRRTRMKVLALESAEKGIRLIFQVPAALLEQQPPQTT